MDSGENLGQIAPKLRLGKAVFSGSAIKKFGAQRLDPNRKNKKTKNKKINTTWAVHRGLHIASHRDYGQVAVYL